MNDTTDQVLVQTRLLHDIATTSRDIRQLLSEAGPDKESRSHVSLSEDAKGNVHPDIKAYAGSPLTGLLEDAMATLCEAKLALPTENSIEAWEKTLEWARARQVDLQTDAA